jgi:hypothetical protein
MAIYNAVKTRAKAKELIESRLDIEINDSELKNSSCFCECGQTSMIQFKQYCDVTGRQYIFNVGICTGCGDDDSSGADVINEFFN